MDILELDRRASDLPRKAVATVVAPGTGTGTVVDGAPACLRSASRPGRDPRWAS